MGRVAIDRKADTCRDLKNKACNGVRRRQSGPRFLRDPIPYSERCCWLNVGQHGDEFVTPIATDGVAAAHAVGKATGYFPQQIVACRIAKPIIDSLKIVNIK